MKRRKILIIILMLACWYLPVKGSTDPPPPTQDEAPICNSYDYDPSTTAPPPPPGLPCVVLPIDDYIPLLMVSGLLLGIFRLSKRVETPILLTNSAEK